MATGAVWVDVPGEGLVLQDPGTSGLPVGTMIPWNADAEYYSATRQWRIQGTEDEGTPAVPEPAGVPAVGETFEEWLAATRYEEGVDYGGWTAWQLWNQVTRAGGTSSTYDPFTGGPPVGQDNVERTVVSRVENADGTTTVTYSDGTTEILEADPLDLDDTFDDPRTAREIVADALRGYGLEALLDDPELNLIGRWQATNNLDAVWAAVRQAPAYTARFPGMQALADQGRAITEAQYVDLEEGYAKALRSYGMAPEYFDSPDDFGDWIAGDVSVSEVTSLLGVATDAVLATTQATKDLLLSWHGIDASDLTAYFLDPERATTVFEEREMLGAARIGGAAAETGFGPLSQETATTLRAAGVTESVARAGFAEIAPSTLAYETASESDDITRAELVGAKFGTDPEAARRIETRRQTRLAAFRQSGGPAMTGSGVVGLGPA